MRMVRKTCKPFVAAIRSELDRLRIDLGEVPVKLRERDVNVISLLAIDSFLEGSSGEQHDRCVR